MPLGKISGSGGGSALRTVSARFGRELLPPRFFFETGAATADVQTKQSSVIQSCDWRQSADFRGKVMRREIA
jgi:hypothetical protein